MTSMENSTKIESAVNSDGNDVNDHVELPTSNCFGIGNFFPR